MSYFKEPDRKQLRWQTIDIEKLIPEEHKVRFFWEICKKLDLTKLYERYKITEESNGRPAYDPRMMLCLLIYAAEEGITSSREIAEECKMRADFMWLCGGLEPEYRAIAYFKAEQGEGIKEAFCEVVLALKEAGLLKGRIYYQDGTKMRANASKSSFRKKSEIEAKIEAAEEAYKTIMEEKWEDEEEKKEVAGRIERDRKKLDEALKTAKEIMERREKRAEEKYGKKWLEKQGEAKASLTDTGCKIMKYGKEKIPAYNAQICMEKESGIIVGAEVNANPTDTWSLIPMLREVKKNLREVGLENYGVDGGYYSNKNIREAEEEGIKNLLINIKKNDKSKEKETQEMKRKLEEEGNKEIIRKRGTIEKIFGNIKENENKFRKFRLRGLKKVNIEWNIICIAYNIMKWFRIVLGDKRKVALAT